MPKMALTLNLGKNYEPQARYYNDKQSGHQKMVVNFSGYETHGKDQPVTFWDVTAFGDLAQHIIESNFPPRTRLILTGYTRTEEWEDRNDGGKRTKLTFIADDAAQSVFWRAIGVQPDAPSGPPAARAPVTPPFEPDEEPF